MSAAFPLPLACVEAKVWTSIGSADGLELAGVGKGKVVRVVRPAIRIRIRITGCGLGCRGRNVFTDQKVILKGQEGQKKVADPFD